MKYAMVNKADGRINLIEIDNKTDLDSLRAAGLRIDDISEMAQAPKTGWIVDAENKYAPQEPAEAKIITGAKHADSIDLTTMSMEEKIDLICTLVARNVGVAIE